MTPKIPALFVLAGLVGGAAAAPVPAPEVAAAQLRALNHRFLDARADPDGAVIDATTHEDFVFIASDGAGHDRARFVAQVRSQPPRDVAQLVDLRVRLHGPVALVHGVFSTPTAGGAPARLRFTDVHVWSGRAWRLVSTQESPLRESVPVELQSGIAPPHAPRRGEEDPHGDDDHVLQLLNEGYVQAFRASDVAWYDAHLAPDYVVVSGDGSLRDRAAALAAFAQPVYATSIRSFPVDQVNVRRFDDVALIHARNAYEMKDGRTGVSRYTDIWLRVDGRWLCIAAHITVQKAPGP